MEIASKKREIKGKKVRILRKSNLIPGVVFGKGKQSTLIKIPFNSFTSVLKMAGESTLLDLSIEGEDLARKVLISEVQRDFVTGKAIHVSFHEVKLKEKISANVPIEFIGESPVVKSGEGILITLIDDVEVECLPMDLPSKFEVDVSKLLEVDDYITVGDLDYDRSKISIGVSEDELLIKVGYAEQLEEETETAVVGDVEVTGEKPEEGKVEEEEAAEVVKEPEGGNKKPDKDK